MNIVLGFTKVEALLESVSSLIDSTEELADAANVHADDPRIAAALNVYRDQMDRLSAALECVEAVNGC